MASSTEPTSTPAPLLTASDLPFLTQQAQPTLPNPSILDILPALHELLARLLPPIPGASDALSSHPAPFPQQESLEISQLAGEVSSIRARIRKARKMVAACEDGDRTVEEQEREMKRLRDRIERQVAMLQSLRRGSDSAMGEG